MTNSFEKSLRTKHVTKIIFANILGCEYGGSKAGIIFFRANKKKLSGYQRK